MKEPKITVLVSDGETWEALKLMRCLGNQGDYSILLQSTSPNAMGKYSRYCKRFHCCKVNKFSEWHSFIQALAENEQIDLIVPIKEKTIKIFSQQIDEVLETVKILPVPRWESLLITLNKWRFHTFVEKIDLPSIPSVLIGISGKKAAKKIDIGGVSFPALLKPTEQEGGHGIKKINDPGELYHLWDNYRKFSQGREYFLQSYLPGVDYCMQLYSREGEILAYTIQRSLQEQEDSYGPQRMMEFVNNDEVLKIGKRLIAALKWDGFACIDFREDKRDRSLRLLEMNPRIGQAILGSVSRGVNLAEIGCRDALGMDLPAHKYELGLYAHPKAHLKHLLSRRRSKEIKKYIRWENSGLKFVCTDPMPEIVKAIATALKYLS